MKIGRNDPCHCGSGQKYKKCCSAKDEAARSAELAAEAAARAATTDADELTQQQQGNTFKAANPNPAGGPRPKGPPPKSPTPVRRRAV